MARSKWTLMLIPHDNERVRSFQVSSNSVRAFLSVILVAVLLSASFSVGFFVKQNQHWRAQRLERENLLLAAEVGQMRGQMQYLSKALDVLAEAIVSGDALVPAISAASILAKVHRDRLCVELDALYPGYGFAAHKGYATAEHLEALRQRGACEVHRRSYAPVREALELKSL